MIAQITRHSLTIFCLLIAFFSSSQNADNLATKIVKQGIIDSTFIFGKWTSTKVGDQYEITQETRYTYLGQVKTSSGRIFKLINMEWHWGLSHRATSRLLVYDQLNRYVGNYYMHTKRDLPIKLEKNFLFFRNSRNPEKPLSKVDFSKGLPHIIYSKYGDHSLKFQ